jgi:hypothetical protein
MTTGSWKALLFAPDDSEPRLINVAASATAESPQFIADLNILEALGLSTSLHPVGCFHMETSITVDGHTRFITPVFIEQRSARFLHLPTNNLVHDTSDGKKWLGGVLVLRRSKGQFADVEVEDVSQIANAIARFVHHCSG